MELSIAKAHLQTLFTETMAPFTFAPILLTRVEKVLDVMKPYENESLVEGEFVNMVVEQFKNNPALFFKDSIIRNGVIYPEMEDDAQAAEVIAGLKETLEAMGPEGAASVAYITRAVSEPFLKAA